MAFHGWFLHVTIWQDAATRSAVRGLVLQNALNSQTLYMRRNLFHVETRREQNKKIVCKHVCAMVNAILNIIRMVSGLGCGECGVMKDGQIGVSSTPPWTFQNRCVAAAAGSSREKKKSTLRSLHLAGAIQPRIARSIPTRTKHFHLYLPTRPSETGIPCMCSFQSLTGSHAELWTCRVVFPCRVTYIGILVQAEASSSRVRSALDC